ncbi:MAG: transglycosylase SLT domain-containing protein [Arenimonas sp.]
MSVKFRYPQVLLLLLVAGVAFSAAAADRYAATYAQMDAAAQRYAEAQVRLQKGDETAATDMTRALEDVEDLARGCMKQKHCNSARVITVYEGMLKSHDLGPGADLALVGEGDEPDHTSPVLQSSTQARQALNMLPDGHQFDAMVEFNEPVQAAMRDWLTSRRGFLIDAHENYQYMRYLMYPEYQRTGLPEALLFGIMAQESGGKVHSVSRSGASGPLQFMPATGYRFGLGRDGSGFDTRFDPQMAARANASYINERFGELNRNLEFTVAAYNGGEGRALRLFQQAGGRSFWSPDVYAQLPAETRDYVPMVIAAAWLYLHPKKYGLEFPRVDTTPDTFQLARASSVNELAICLGNGGTRDGWFRVLRNLNPRYEASQYIPAGAMLRAPKKVVQLYRSRCVSGPRAQMAAQIANANKDALIAPGVSIASGVTIATGKPTAMPSARTHSVRSGENLVAIARNYSCDLKELAQANQLRGPAYVVRTGVVIKLKGCGR